jgi:hypothetical protein
MTHPDDFKYIHKTIKKNKKKAKKENHSVVWHFYHTILAVELGMIVVIEFIELMRDIT